MNPEIVEWFGQYARLVAERFSDRVKYFFTLNEPQCFVGLGFLQGCHAPGVKAPLRDTFEMAHNALKAHGRAVQMLRAYGKQNVQIGYAPTSGMCYPEKETPKDIEAARKALLRCRMIFPTGPGMYPGGLILLFLVSIRKKG